MLGLNLLKVTLVAALLFFGWPVLQEHSPQCVKATAAILILGYLPYVLILHKLGRTDKIVSSSVFWVTGWIILLVVFDMANPTKNYQFGPVIFIWTVPFSVLIGAVVGFFAKKLLAYF